MASTTGTIPKDFSLLCIKDNLSVIENLPEEILLEICTYLGLKDLGRCLQVSKRFRKISKDKKLWQRITLFRKEVPIEFIGQALTFGLKHLSVEGCNLNRKFFDVRANISIDLPMILDLYPKKNELKSLVLNDVHYRKNHHFTEHLQYVTTLLESCHSLEKLHFGGSCYFNFPKCIAQNVKP